MTRSGDPIVLKPANNIYTVLVIIALLVEVIGVLAMVVRSPAAFGPGQGLFSSSDVPPARVGR